MKKTPKKKVKKTSALPAKSAEAKQVATPTPVVPPVPPQSVVIGDLPAWAQAGLPSPDDLRWEAAQEEEVMDPDDAPRNVIVDGGFLSG